MKNKYLTTKETCKILGIHYNTLARLRSQGQGPKFYKMNNLIFYTIDDIETYQKSLITYIDPQAKKRKV